MTINFPSPLAMKTFYTSRGRAHVSTVYLLPGPAFVPTPGLDPDQYEIALNNGIGTTDFPIVASVFVDGNGVAEGLPETARGGLRRLLAPSDNIERVELWYYPPQSNNGLFLTSISFNTAGNTTDVSTPVPANQLTMTFRTSEGGIMRVQFMEIASDNTTTRYTYVSAPDRIKVWINTVLDPTYPYVGKDGGRPIAFLRASMTQNEKLYRKVYR